MEHQISEHCSVDVVVDTNVLAHADDPKKATSQASQQLLLFIKESELKWVLDDQGKKAPNPETSLLHAEYRNTIVEMGFSATVFAFLLRTNRVIFAPRPGEQVRKAIRKLVPANKGDQAVLGAAVGSTDGVLVSNDFGDFTAAVRTSVLKELSVTVVDCECG